MEPRVQEGHEEELVRLIYKIYNKTKTFKTLEIAFSKNNITDKGPRAINDLSIYLTICRRW